MSVRFLLFALMLTAFGDGGAERPYDLFIYVTIGNGTNLALTRIWDFVFVDLLTVGVRLAYCGGFTLLADDTNAAATISTRN